MGSFIWCGIIFINLMGQSLEFALVKLVWWLFWAEMRSASFTIWNRWMDDRMDFSIAFERSTSDWVLCSVMANFGMFNENSHSKYSGKWAWAGQIWLSKSNRNALKWWNFLRKNQQTINSLKCNTLSIFPYWTFYGHWSLDIGKCLQRFIRQLEFFLLNLYVKQIIDLNTMMYVYKSYWKCCMNAFESLIWLVVNIMIMLVWCSNKP